MPQEIDQEIGKEVKSCFTNQKRHGQPHFICFHAKVIRRQQQLNSSNILWQVWEEEKFYLTIKKGIVIILFQFFLEEEFPKLKKTIAFTLYKCQSGGSGCRPLEKIPIGPVGYTIPWLKDNCRLGSACIYVNPIQDTLSVDPISPENVSF